jgi:hypothetical protein
MSADYRITYAISDRLALLSTLADTARTICHEASVNSAVAFLHRSFRRSYSSNRQFPVAVSPPDAVSFVQC